MRCAIICTVHRILYADRSKEHEMDWRSSTRYSHNKRRESSFMKPKAKKYLSYLRLDEMIKPKLL